MTIWKYEIPVTGSFSVPMPKGSEIIAFQSQNDHLCIWAQVNPSNEKEERKFHLVGTGHEIPKTAGHYWGTAQMANGSLVWHLYTDTDY